MKKPNEIISYVRGLLKGAEMSDDTLSEVFNLILNAMEEEDATVQKLSEQLDELDEYVESIDDDLANMEDLLNDLNDDLFDEDDMDFDEDEDEGQPLRLVKKNHECKCGHHHKDGHSCHCHDDEEPCDCEAEEEDDEAGLDGFDNLFLGAMCPECNRLFCVTDADFDDPEALYHCPYCGKDVHISPIDPKNVPIAERVDR
ncbi:MAG: hypothetical protein Q4E13_11585 [Clostridia bacterium]|nr:hypothetical protein [Clostridia bacterium]